MFRHHTSIDLHASKLHSIKKNLSSDYLTANLYDINKQPVVTLYLLHDIKELDINIIHNISDIQVINDCMNNKLTGFLLSKFIGISFDKCEKRYVIVYKQAIIAKVIYNYLENTVKLKCKSSYKWVIKDTMVPPLRKSTSADFGEKLGDNVQDKFLDKYRDTSFSHYIDMLCDTDNMFDFADIYVSIDNSVNRQRRASAS